MQDKHIIIEITKKCNLHCKYCYQIHSNKDIDETLLLEIIRLECSKNKEDKITFDLCGGEPFLCFNLIKKIVTSIREKKLNSSLYIITNGTLIHGEIQEYLIKNRDIIDCCLSLDGMEETHNSNRCNSFCNIDIEFFQKYFSKVPISMTITIESIPNIARNIIFCHERGFSVNCGFTTNENWENVNIYEYQQQLAQIVEYYLKHPQITRCNLIPNLEDAHHLNKGQIKWCDACVKTLAYSVDGEISPCQMLLGSKINLKKLIETKMNGHQNDSCIICPVVHLCPTCFALNFIKNGDYLTKYRGLCELRKVGFLASTYLYYRLWKINEINLSQDIIELMIEIQEKLR